MSGNNDKGSHDAAMPGNDAASTGDDADSVPEGRFEPRSTSDLVAEAERQLASVVSLAREHLRRVRVTLNGQIKDRSMASGDARSTREMGDMMLNILKWKYPKGKPDDHDRPLEDIMAELLATPEGRKTARKLLKESE